MAETCEKVVTDYWLKHYTPKHHCGLCGNRGIIDTRGVRTPAGFEVGDQFWCICPNGQALRKQVGGNGPDGTGKQKERGDAEG